jgi:redox-sensitive bicupin YhaK (pirin superfamily)
MIAFVLDAHRKDLGGFEVARALPMAQARHVGPFVFLDQMGPAAFAAGQGIDVRPHPHIGLATLTYLFEGAIHHRDSTGVHQPILPGAVNWMTAGRGIVHSERTDPALRASGWRMHGMQAWIALPVEVEEVEPSFAHHLAETIPAFGDGAARLRLIAGEAYGLRSPAQGASPLFYVHATLGPGGRVAAPGGYRERAAYVAEGAIEVAGRAIRAGQLVVFAPGESPVLTSEAGATVMLLGGESVGERHLWWNFVSSSKERIEQAKADWAAGRMALPEGDDQEFIPLPQT